MNLLYSPKPCFFMTHCNIIIPSTLQYSNQLMVKFCGWSFQFIMCTFLPHTSTSHSPLSDRSVTFVTTNLQMLVPLQSLIIRSHRSVAHILLPGCCERITSIDVSGTWSMQWVIFQLQCTDFQYSITPLCAAVCCQVAASVTRPAATSQGGSDW